MFHNNFFMDHTQETIFKLNDIAGATKFLLSIYGEDFNFK